MSTTMEFVIPLSKDDLLKRRAGQYFVNEIIPSQSVNKALDVTRTSLQNQGPKFILQHFDDFFSVLTHGNKLDNIITIRAFDRIAKSLEFLVQNLEKEFPSQESRPESLMINKMHAYIVCSLITYLEDTTLALDTNQLQDTGRKKKKPEKAEAREDWEEKLKKTLLIIDRWLQLPLQKLWQPPIVEESFVQLIADICYKILEHDKHNKGESEVRRIIFHILGILVKRYLHSVTCTIKIIQLVKMNEAVGPYLAVGVVDMVNSNECPGFIAELVREIDGTSLDETSARNVASFLEAIAATKPELILPILNGIIDYHESEWYSLRNCAITILGIVIKGCLTRENLTAAEKKRRDECFDILEAHTLDVNTYVRSKVFQTFQKLCCEAAVPVQRYASLMEKSVNHLRDQAATVRKQALVSVRTLLESNPFRQYIDRKIILERKQETIAMHTKIQEDIVSQSGSGDEERQELWKSLSPEIVSAIKNLIDDESEDLSSDDGEDDEQEEDDEEDDDDKYERIRNLIIQKNFAEALKRVVRITKREIDASVDDLDAAEKERFYHHILLFIFMESSEEDGGQSTSAKFQEQKKKIADVRKVLSFLQSAETFAAAIEQALEQIELMLFSPNASVAVEACSLLASAHEYNIPGTARGTRKALSQVFSDDESVRNNVAKVYSNIYLVKDGQKVATLSAVNGLISLFKNLQPGQSPALSKLISIWLESKALNERHIEIMWQIFAQKIAGVTIDDRRSAILLLSMVAQSQPTVITANVDIIVQLGLEPTEGNDILLARDCCRALMAIQPKDHMESPVKFMNSDQLFNNLFEILEKNFKTIDVDIYVSFANEAINVIFHLANQPSKLIQTIIRQLNSEMNENEVESPTLAKFLYIIGHVSIKHMAFLDTAVYRELKRRNAIVQSKSGKKDQLKPGNISVCSPASVQTSARSARRKSMYSKQNDEHDESGVNDDAGQEALGGASADDTEAEAIEEELEANVINGSDALLADFVPLIVDICQNPEKYNNLIVHAFAVQALTKMMTISAQFCQKHLQLLITILERSTYPEIRANILIGLGDLMTRFPNEVEPWENHLYGRLKDTEVSVRSTAVRVLASLVKRGMIRVKGDTSDMALCIIDQDPQIKLDAKQFFEEISKRGNLLYNILPDILSRLTTVDVQIEEDEFHEITKHILGLLAKERESDALLNKICQRMKMATTDRQCRDLAFCLSLIKLGKRGIVRLTANLPLIKNKLHIREVQKALKEIIENARKKADNKEVAGQLENEMDKLLDDDNDENQDNDNQDEDRIAMPPPMTQPKVTKSSKERKPSRKKNSREEEEEDEKDEEKEEENEENNSRNTRRRSSRTTSANPTSAKRKSGNRSPDEDESEFRAKGNRRTPSSRTVKTEETPSLRRSTRRNSERTSDENPAPKRGRSRK